MGSAENEISAEVAALASDWAAVGGDLREAAVRTARELGGEEFAREVELLAGSDDPLPDAEAFFRLEAAFPGAAALAFDLGEKIAETRRNRERRGAEHAGLRSGIWRGLHDGFGLI